MRVNKLELTRILGCSIPTLNNWIAGHGEAFPIIERGTNGRDWAFDHEEVLAFLAARREEQGRQAAERNHQLAQLSLPMGHNGGPSLDGDGPPPPLKPSELLAMAKLRKLEREEAYARGLLVEARKVNEVMTEIWTELRKHLHSMADRFASNHGLSDPVRAALHSYLDDCQRRFVDQLQRSLSPPSGARQPELFGDGGADESAASPRGVSEI